MWKGASMISKGEMLKNLDNLSFTVYIIEMKLCGLHKFHFLDILNYLTWLN